MAAKGRKPARRGKRGAKAAPAKKRGVYHFLSWVLAPLLYVVFFPTALVLTVGMVPTLIAYLIIDRTRQKYATKTVGWLNLAGAFAICMVMWKGDHSTEKAMELLVQPISWVLMYGATALGWMLYFGVRPVVAAYLSVKTDAKRKVLRAQQRDLIREWGDSVRQGAQEWESEQGRAADDDDLADNEDPPGANAPSEDSDAGDAGGKAGIAAAG